MKKLIIFIILAHLSFTINSSAVTQDEKDLEKNFTSCLGGLKIIKDGWETEAIPQKVDKNAKKISFFAKIFKSN